MFNVQTTEAGEASERLLGVVSSRWAKDGVEGALLSRVCSRELAKRLDRLARIGARVQCLRMRFVWGGRESGLGPDVSHVVLAWEGAGGDRGAAGFCVCGQIAVPDNDPW